MVLTEQLETLGIPAIPPPLPHLEGWYTSHLWSPLFDHGFLALPSLTTERQEASCLASALRRNHTRTDTRSRARVGPKLDAIMRSIVQNGLEYGGMEHARTASVSSSKALMDAQKLARALMRGKAMDVRRLCKVVAHVQRVGGVVEECVGLVEGKVGVVEGGAEERIRELMFGKEETGVVEGGLARAPNTP